MAKTIGLAVIGAALWHHPNGGTEVRKKGRQRGHGTQADTPRVLYDFNRSSVASGQGTMSPFGSRNPNYQDSELPFLV